MTPEWQRHGNRDAHTPGFGRWRRGHRGGMSSTPEYAADANTLTALISQFAANGFEGQLAAREDGELMCFSCHELHGAETFTLDDLRRTEGASDPADMAAVAALTCPSCGAKGTAVFKFGPEAAVEDAEALHRLER